MNNLQKRIITSILLFLLVIFCIFENWPIYLFLLLKILLLKNGYHLD